MSLSLVRPQTTELKPRIVVFGVGGAGGNAVNNMIDAGLEGVEFVVANTDAQHLSFAKTDRRIQLGETITQGLGAGAHPEVGMNAAEESANEIDAHLEGAHMVFITAGMGGGTGTGAAPIIARRARDRGILTVGVVTKPFTFEGRHRMRLADSGIAELQRYVDTLIVIPNQNLFRVANERTTFSDAFGMADQVLHSGVRSITDLMILPGLINLDFADVRAVMSEMGKAMMGTGEATGEERALLAAQNAIANPLLDETSLKGAKAVLVNITGGMDMTLLEVDEAANAISAEVDPDANIIFGAAFDPALDGKLRVSVVATGMDEAVIGKIEPVAPPRRETPQAPRYADATQVRAPEPAPAQPVMQREPAPEPVIQPVMRSAEPVIRPAVTAEAPRNLDPIVDPWVEQYEADPVAARVEPEIESQGDLYMDRQPKPAPRQPEPEPAPLDDDMFDEPRRGGWSLFGRGKPRQPERPVTPSRNDTRSAYEPQPQMRPTQSAQPVDQSLEAPEEDLEIPSFLRRLAN